MNELRMNDPKTKAQVKAPRSAVKHQEGFRESIGERLKAERIRRNLTVDEINLRIRIHPEVIRRLESNEFSEWPGGNTYLKGFLKQYARFLSLPAEELLSEYEGLGISDRAVELDIGIHRHQAVPQPEKRHAQKKTTLTFSPDEWWKKNSPAATGVIRRWGPTVIWILVGFLAFRLIWGGVGMLKNFYGSAAATASKAWGSNPKAKKPAAKPGPDLSDELNAPEPARKSSLAHSASRGDFPRIAPTEPIVMELTATKDVWMQIKSDGEILFQQILRQKDRERWEAGDSFELRLGRPEGVEMTLNGVKIGKPAEGKFKTLRITRDGIQAIA